MAEPATQGVRLKALDVLRAVAVLLVFGRHFNLFDAYYRGGWSGVDLFFVLSGFLISGLLFTDYKRSGRIRCGRFLLRRGFKIYPPFYALMAWTVLMYLLHHGHLKMRPLLSELFFLQSYVQGMWVTTWSLAVEEHFYLSLPFLLLLLARLGRHREDPFRALPWIYLVVAAASLALRIHLCSVGPRPFEVIRYPSHLCVDTLLLGVVLSYLHHFRPAVFGRLTGIPGWLLLPASLCMVAPCFFVKFDASRLSETLGYSVMCLGYGGLVLYAMSAVRVPDRFRWLDRLGDGLAFVGKYSYSIYLWHAAVFTWGMELLRRWGYLPSSPAPQFMIAAVGSLALGVLMARIVELPSLRLRDRLFPAFTRSSPQRTLQRSSPGPIASTAAEAG